MKAQVQREHVIEACIKTISRAKKRLAVMEADEEDVVADLMKNHKRFFFWSHTRESAKQVFRNDDMFYGRKAMHTNTIHRAQNMLTVAEMSVGGVFIVLDQGDAWIFQHGEQE
jgi:hypothetical protein